MSLYLIVFIMLVGFAIYEYFKRSTQKWLYWIAFSVLTVMLCFRYGQGTDYFGYYYNYLLTPPLQHFKQVLDGSIHGELGWLLVCSTFRTLNTPFELLVGIVSAFEMYCLHRFISRYSPMWTVSLLLTFPTLYLTYAMSALRQGLVLLVFLGFMIDWLYCKKVKPYLIATLVCTLFHSSALVFLALFAIRLFTLDTKKTLILLVICTGAGFAVSRILPMISSVFAHYTNSTMSLTAIGERAVSTLLILSIFHDILDQHKKHENGKLLFLLQIYLYGSLIYCFLMWNALISSRFAVYFKAVEIVLYAIAIRSRNNLSKTTAVYLLVLTVVMYFKNIDSYISQGLYYETVNILNYPYISVLLKNAISSFREIQYNFDLLLG